MMLSFSNLATFATAIGIGASSFAQSAIPQNQSSGVTVDRNAAQASYDSTATTGVPLATRSVRAGQLIGLNVQDRNNRSLGEINDLVMNEETGKVAYAALSVGGVLGIGDELFAVPFDAFAIKADDDDADPTSNGQTVADDLGDYVAVLDANADTFKNAKGFNQNAWPNMADPKWRSLNDQAYDTARKSRMASADYAPHLRRMQDEANADRAALKTYRTFRASEIEGLNFEVGDVTAEVEDIVLDAHTGKVNYVAVNYDGKMYAVPAKAIKIARDSDDDLSVQFAGGQAWFQGAQAFDEDHWPTTVASTGAAAVR